MHCNLAPRISRLHASSSCQKMVINMKLKKQKSFTSYERLETPCRSRFYVGYRHQLWRRHRCGIVRFIKNVPHASGSRMSDRLSCVRLTGQGRGK